MQKALIKSARKCTEPAFFINFEKDKHTNKLKGKRFDRRIETYVVLMAGTKSKSNQIFTVSCNFIEEVRSLHSKLPDAALVIERNKRTKSSRFCNAAFFLATLKSAKLSNQHFEQLTDDDRIALLSLDGTLTAFAVYFDHHASPTTSFFVKYKAFNNM